MPKVSTDAIREALFAYRAELAEKHNGACPHRGWLDLPPSEQTLRLSAAMMELVDVMDALGDTDVPSPVTDDRLREIADGVQRDYNIAPQTIIYADDGPGYFTLRVRQAGRWVGQQIKAGDIFGPMLIEAMRRALSQQPQN